MPSSSTLALRTYSEPWEWFQWSCALASPCWSRSRPAPSCSTPPLLWSPERSDRWTRSPGGCRPGTGRGLGVGSRLEIRNWWERVGLRWDALSLTLRPLPGSRREQGRRLWRLLVWSNTTRYGRLVILKSQLRLKPREEIKVVVTAHTRASPSSDQKVKGWKDLLRQIGAEEFQLWPSQTTVLLPSIVEPSLHLQQEYS